MGRGLAVALALALALLLGCSKPGKPKTVVIPTQDFAVPVLGRKAGEGAATTVTVRVLVPDGYETRTDQFGLAVKRKNHVIALFSVGAMACVAGLHGDACLDYMEQSMPGSTLDVKREKLRPGVMRITLGIIETIKVYHAGSDALIHCSATRERPEDFELARRACAELVMP